MILDTRNTTTLPPRDPFRTQDAYLAAVEAKLRSVACEHFSDWTTGERAYQELSDKFGESVPKPMVRSVVRGVYGACPGHPLDALLRTGKQIKTDKLLAPVVIDDFLREGEVGAFIAPTKVGKSWTAMHLSQCVALGIPWLGRDVPQPRKVIYMDSELQEQTFDFRANDV